MHLLSRARRPRRAHEWSPGKAVTFIVTLAATRSVTLAATEAGMSRKSVYALKGRDPAFAAAWDEAVKARFGGKGDKVDEMEEPPVSSIRVTGGFARQGQIRQSRNSPRRAKSKLCAATSSSRRSGVKRR